MAFASRDFRREAVFLCSTFFLTALSSADIAFFKLSADSMAFPSAINARVFLTALLNLNFVRVLITFRRRD